MRNRLHIRQRKLSTAVLAANRVLAERLEVQQNRSL